VEAAGGGTVEAIILSVEEQRGLTERRGLLCEPTRRTVASRAARRVKEKELEPADDEPERLSPNLE
jgi:hypothetical protein